MKLAFGPALPVGTAGEREYVDVWLTRYVPIADAIESLAGSLAPELAPAEAIYVGDKEPSLGAACTIGVYEVYIRGGGVAEARIRKALDEVISEGELRVEHKGKNKVFDLAVSLPKGVVVESSGVEGVRATVVTRMGQNGSLRPEALVAHALSRSDITGAVTLVTRLDTLFEEEGEFRRPV